ncbi:MAG: hypothetical protein E7672_09755 [Ruminococcaceae bacterium]|nr:hypothetical protein [Oscillospiraceae bacterium]
MAVFLDIPSDEIIGAGYVDPRASSVDYQNKKENKELKKPQIEAWKDLKFGMFITYGIYSMIGRINEWVMFYEPIDRDDYAEIAKDFSAEKFDAKYYADLATKTGMKYMVLVTRHHDGFCLFDSKYSYRDFTVMNTKAKRDLVREFTDACRGAGLGVGLYYSPMDWRFKGFFFPQMYRKSAEAMREQGHGQIRELCENYGKVDILWFDGGDDCWFGHGMNMNVWNPERIKPDYYTPIPDFWQTDKVDKMIHELQPDIIVNNRFGRAGYGDFGTPERKVGNFDNDKPWETCHTMLDKTWGWLPDRDVRPFESIVNLLVDCVTGGGNLLLNVSPRGDGSLDKEQEVELLKMGEWMDKYGDCIYGTRGGPAKNNAEIGGFTCKDNKIYAFLKPESEGKFQLPLLSARVESVISRSGDKLEWKVKDDILDVSAAKDSRDQLMTVIEITLDREVQEHYSDFDYESFDAFKI